MTYPELMNRLQEENKNILADDPRFDFSILIIHDDGVLLQERAFCEQRGEYLVAFGEHMPPTAFDLCAVKKWAMFEYSYPIGEMF